MIIIRIILFVVTIGIFNALQAQEQSYSMPQIIVTSPAPGAAESVVVPAYYNNCFIVPAGYYDNVWVAEREVCQYNSTKGSALESGYWRCTQYNTEGVCANWDWVPPHWTQTESIY